MEKIDSGQIQKANISVVSRNNDDELGINMSIVSGGVREEVRFSFKNGKLSNSKDDSVVSISE